MKKEYYEVYKPEYERIKKDALEAKTTKEDDEAKDHIMNKDSLIEFGDGDELYKESSDEEDDLMDDTLPVARSSKKNQIKTIPEEEEGKIRE